MTPEGLLRRGEARNKGLLRPFGARNGVCMRKKEKEITDKGLIEEILREAAVCRIAMSENNRPYVVPMNFGYENDTLYLHTGHKGRKIDILSKNPLVCFEAESRVETVRAESACGWGMRYLSVIGSGRASFVNDPAGKRTALGIIMKKYSGRPDWEYSDKDFEATRIVRIEIEEMTGKKSGY